MSAIHSPVVCFKLTSSRSLQERMTLEDNGQTTGRAKKLKDDISSAKLNRTFIRLSGVGATTPAKIHVPEGVVKSNPEGGSSKVKTLSIDDRSPLSGHRCCADERTAVKRIVKMPTAADVPRLQDLVVLYSPLSRKYRCHSDEPASSHRPR